MKGWLRFRIRPVGWLPFSADMRDVQTARLIREDRLSRTRSDVCDHERGHQ